MARLADARRAFLLVGECVELGDDPKAWREHLFAGLAKLTDSDLVLGGEMAIPKVGVPKDMGTAEWGWQNGFDRTGWINAMTVFNLNPLSSPAFAQYLSELAAEDGVVKSRPELFPDGDWYRSHYYEVVHRTAGIDPSLHCFRRVGYEAHAFSGIIVNRAAGRPEYTRREKALFHEVHTVVAGAVGGALAGMKDPSPADLSPRRREVLACLLEGDSDKQVAVRLKISPHTVNQHAKAIFAHFDVRSRPELLARWVRRRWGRGFAWDPRGK